MKLTDLWHKVRMKRTHTNTSTRIQDTQSSFHLFYLLTYMGRVSMWKGRWAVVSLLVIQIREPPSIQPPSPALQFLAGEFLRVLIVPSATDGFFWHFVPPSSMMIALHGLQSRTRLQAEHTGTIILLPQLLFSYASSATLYPCEPVGGWVVVSNLCSFEACELVFCCLPVI